MATLRLADEVNEALKAAASRDPQGRSVTKLANDLLAAVAGSYPDLPTRRAMSDAGWTVPAPPSKPGPAPKPETQKCPPHPTGRVIDGMCMACGNKA